MTMRRGSSSSPPIGSGARVSLLALFQWAFRFLHLRLGLYTVIVAHIAFSIPPYVVILVSSRLRTYDRTLEEAAMDLGASEWGAFFRVTVPSIAPAVAAAGLLALVVSFDDYVITSLVAGVDSTTLPMVIYAMARRGVSPVECRLRADRRGFWRHRSALAETERTMNRRVFLLGTTALAACARDSRPRLNVFNWSTYIDPAMLARFERERGVRIRYGTYESNEEMLARVLTGNSGWDVVFPTHSRSLLWRGMASSQPSIAPACRPSGILTRASPAPHGTRNFASASLICGTLPASHTTAPSLLKSAPGTIFGIRLCVDA